MIDFNDGTLRVNLLFNRASKWADIDSHIPFKGQVDVHAKRKLNLEMRLPEWAKPEEAKAVVNGKERKLTFDGRYAKIGKVKKGQTASLIMPIRERTQVVPIQGPPGGVNDYTMIIRGNSVVSIDPPGKYNPLYQGGHYRTGETLYQKVERYIPEDEFPWW